MTTTTDLYAILGLDRHATQAQISHAYRTLLRRFHPDTRTPGDRSRDATSDAALQKILAAYAVLRDPDRRAEYDQQHSPPPTLAPGRLIFVPQPGTGDESPLRAGPVHWNPWPP